MTEERKFVKIYTFLNIARQLSKLSTCQRYKVGAVITDQTFKVLSMGYNGRASGRQHCQDAGPQEPGLCDCIHRQQNRIIFGGHYQHLTNKKLFVTLSPCLPCRRLLNQFGVKQVYYYQQYRDSSPIDYLLKNGIKCIKVIEKEQQYD